MNHHHSKFWVVLLLVSSLVLLLSSCDEYGEMDEEYDNYIAKENLRLTMEAARLTPSSAATPTFTPSPASQSRAEVVPLYPGAQEDTSPEAQLKAQNANGAIYITADTLDKVDAFYNGALAGRKDLSREEVPGVITYSFVHASGDASIPRVYLSLMNTSPDEDSSVNILAHLRTEYLKWQEQEYYRVQDFGE